MHEEPNETQAPASAPPELREISPEDLKLILAKHKKWLESGGNKGKKADLRGANLAGFDLRKANLSQADLQEANLSKAALDEANLSEATMFDANLTEAGLHTVDLSAADLRGVDFQGARLINTQLRDAELQSAKLSGAIGLSGPQFAGTNVSGAKLPPVIAKFEGLGHVEETSKNARKIFLAMLLGCVYSWLTIATTTDAPLLTNSASSPLPIIQTEVPVAGFYWAAPLILLGVFFYLHLYLQRLWEGLAKLPAVFPDGRALHERAYPWLLNGLVRAHFRRLQETRSLLSRFENWVSIILAWWVVPATLLLFWGRYLPRHHWAGTILHLALLVMSVWAAIMLHRHAVRTLRGVPTDFHWMKPWWDARTYQAAAALGIGVIFWGLSYGAINGVPPDRYSNPFLLVKPPKLEVTDLRRLVPKTFALIGYSPFANLREVDVSTKPEDWRGEEGDITLVKGASLKGRDLRYADASGAFLVKADLSKNANLQEADFSGADLRGANLSQAKLQAVTFTRAKLQGANLKQAHLKGAILLDANLTKANLYGVDLQGTELQGADLMEVDLLLANLCGANLRGAKNVTQAQLDKSCGDEKTTLPEEPKGLQIEICPGLDLSGRDLRGFKGLTRAQLNASCGDDDTKLPEGLTIKPCQE